MEAIGQKFVASVAQGRLPEGGQHLRSFPEHAQEQVSEARQAFDSVRLLDGTPADRDRRPGHISIDYGDSADGAYRAHGYEASFQGTPEAGTVTELRHFPGTEQARAITDATWTNLDGSRMTSLTYLQLDGENRVEYASLNRVDTEHPDQGQAIGWQMGFDTATLDNASGWLVT